MSQTVKQLEKNLKFVSRVRRNIIFCQSGFFYDILVDGLPRTWLVQYKLLSSLATFLVSYTGWNYILASFA